MMFLANRYKNIGSHIIIMKKNLLHILRKYKSVKELSDNNRILKFTVLNGDYLNRNALHKAIIFKISENPAW